MSSVKIIACGLSPATLTLEAQSALSTSHFFVGAHRLLANFAPRDAEQAEAYLAEDVAALIDARPGEDCAILVSGDSGFYSAAAAICRALGQVAEVYPGISSLSYFFAKLGRPWQQAKIISCHGRQGHLLSAVRRNAEVFSLTGNNTSDLLQHLTDFGFGDLTVTLGENLGFPTEKIRSGQARDLAAEQDYSSLTVLLVDNPSASKAIASGIADSEFIRASLPMTKRVIRAQVLSLLNLEPDDICLDLGCGTGSVSIEMALAAYEGEVIALDKEEEAGRLIAENARKFQVDNIRFQQGNIPEFLSTEPRCDKIFLGGGGAQVMDPVMAFFSDHTEIKRLLLTAISLESLKAALDALESNGLSANIMQIQASHARELGSNHLLMGENPTFIVEVGR